MKHLKSITGQRSDHRESVLARYNQWMLNHRPGSPYPEAVAGRIAEVLTAPEPEHTGCWSPSSAHLCPRRQALAFAGFPPSEQPSWYQHTIADDGHWRRRKLQANLLTAGLLTRIEVPLADPQTRLRGTADGVNDVEGWGLVIEGTNLPSDRLPLNQHVQQVTCYALMSGISRWVILYDHTTSDQLSEQVVDVTAGMLEAEHLRLARLNTLIEAGDLPPVLPECANDIMRAFGHSPWKFCPYNQHCQGG